MKYTVKTAGFINGVYYADGATITLTDEQAAYYRGRLAQYRAPKADAPKEEK